MRNTLARRCAAEAAGAFILVLIGPGAAAVDRSYAHGALGPVGIALAFLLALLAGIGAFAPVSGAHFNPAVTLGFWSIGRFRSSDVVPYIIAQCGGAALAAFLLRGVVGDAVRAAATVPAISIGRAFAVEFVFSAVLMAVILRVSSDGRVSATLAAISVSACVGGLALMGALTGSSMNPARSFGPALASGEWQSHWIYWAAPVSGMMLIAWLFTRLTRAGHTPGLALESPLGVEGPFETSIAL